MPDGSGYVKLLDFAGATNGRRPTGSLISDGTFLYGMTYSGGTNDLGTIFKIMPDGSGYVKLLDFTGVTNGSTPSGSLISDGTFLYGMNSDGGTNDMGTIFKIMPDGSGYVKLLDFAGATNGRTPYGSLISDGTFLYGMTSQGGTNNDGVIFKYGLPAGLDEISRDADIALYPNPTTGKFTISSRQGAIKKVEVYDLFGRKLLEPAEQETLPAGRQVDMRGFAKGVYVVRVGDAVRKLVVR